MKNIMDSVNKHYSDNLDYVGKNATLQNAMKLADSDLKTFEEKGIQASLMSNFQRKVMDSEWGRDFMKTSNYGPFLPEVLPVIQAWYPNFPLKDLISVQDMQEPIWYIVTSELMTGTTKAPTLAGELVETPSGSRQIKGSYPTGDIFGEIVETADIDDETEGSDSFVQFALAYFPVIGKTEKLAKTKLSVTTGGNVVDLYPTSSANGNIELADESGAYTATIEQQTGVVSMHGFTSASAIESVDCAYVWNIEYANNKNIPTVVEDMKMKPMVAEPFAIAMKWTIFAEMVKERQFGKDIKTANTQRVLDLLYQMQVRYVLDHMYRFADKGTAEQTIYGVQTSVIDSNYKAQKIMENLNTVSMMIAYNTGRIEGNRLVVGAGFKNYLESLPAQWYQPVQEADYGFQGPRKIGQFGRYMVFFDNELGWNKGFMTYRGSQWYDASYYAGMFMPFTPTDAININIDVQQAFAYMAAYEYDKPNGVIKLDFKLDDAKSWIVPSSSSL